MGCFTKYQQAYKDFGDIEYFWRAAGCCKKAKRDAALLGRLERNQHFTRLVEAEESALNVLSLIC